MAKYILKAETGYFTKNKGKLPAIKQVVSSSAIDDFIDTKIGHKHGWAWAAKELAKEADRREKLLIECRKMLYMLKPMSEALGRDWRPLMEKLEKELGIEK